MLKFKYWCHFFIFLISISALGQNSQIKNGLYGSVVEFKNNTPLADPKIRIKHVKNSNLSYLYQLSASKKQFSKDALRKDIWAYYKNGNFYLNIESHGLVSGYVLFTHLKKYNSFVGMYPSTANKERTEHIGREASFLLSFVANSPYAIKSYPNNNEYEKLFEIFVLDMGTGNLNILEESYIDFLLEPYPDLHLEFHHMVYAGSYKTLLEFLEKLNQREKF
jgi:hypothetical protein